MAAIGIAVGGVAIPSGTAGASSHASKSASACTKYKAGKAGVVQTFCTGPAKVRVTVGSTSYQINGGKCLVSGGFFTINSGVIVGPNYPGAKPSYFGLDAPNHSGSFTNATIGLDVGGKGIVMTQNSGTVAANKKGGTFAGKDLVTSASVSGSFTC